MPREKRDEWGLTVKQRAFADLYRAGPDDMRGKAAACYKEIYPRTSKSSCETAGPRLLRDDNVQAYLAHCSQEATQKADVTQERIISQLAALGFADVRHLFNEQGQLLRVDQLSDGVAAAIESVEVVTKSNGADAEDVAYVHKYKLSNKVKPLELLGKHLQMFVELQQVNHKGLESLIEVLKQASGTPASHPMERIKNNRDAGEQD